MLEVTHVSTTTGGVWGTSTTIEVPLPDHPGWYASATYILRENETILAELRVFPADGRPAAGEARSIGGWVRPDYQQVAPPIGQWTLSREFAEMVGRGPKRDRERVVKKQIPGALASIPTAGIQGRMLRNIPTGELKSLCSDLLRQAMSEDEPGSMPAIRKAAAKLRRGFGEKRTEHDLAEIARIYVGLSKDHAPNMRLAELLGLPNADHARDLVSSIRNKHHLLTTPGQGQRGGMLTSKALDLLKEGAVTPTSLPDKKEETS